MKKHLLLFSLISSFSAFSQFGPVNLIDNTVASQGIRRIITADLDNDNQNEVVVAQAFNNNLAYYPNTGNGTFGTKIRIDSTSSFPVSVAAEDLNGDHFTDLVALAQTYGEVMIYLNDGNAHFIHHEIDSGNMFFNGLVIEDFDHDGTKDLVVIGQHSIDLYHNDGSAVFTKEHILTTATSPNVLECMYIETADMNNDGHPDVVTAETIGGVIYFNDGTGTFTPYTFTSEQLITRLVHAVDINNDGFKDVVVQHSTGDVKLYISEGDGTFQLAGTLFNAPSLTSMQSVDADADGFMDLYMAYSNKARMLFNNGNETFGNQTFLYENNALFINEVCISNLDANPDPEFIWSAAGGTIAYHKSTVLSVSESGHPEIQIYPNPCSGIIRIESAEAITELCLLDSQGQKIEIPHDFVSIDLSGLAPGSYLLRINRENQVFTKKVVKI